MKKSAISICLILFSLNIFPQKVDSFLDGDYTSSPVWSGDTGDWEIVQNSTCSSNPSDSYTLHLNANSSDNTKYLSTQISSWGTEQSWGGWIGRRSGHAPSSSNQSIVWLFSNESDLNSSTADGYRILLGENSDDNIYLQRVTNGVATNIITSNDVISSKVDDYGILLRVTRKNTGEWTLFSSSIPQNDGEGATALNKPSISNANINQGSVIDNTYTNFSGGYIGVVANYTSTGNEGAEFDQFYFATSSTASLPVKLNYFEGKYLDEKVLLNWQTETEVNNYGFNLERKSGNENWSKIKFIAGAGNSNTKNEYSFVDTISVSGKYLYRLKQLDFEGQYEYSDVIEINIPKPSLYKLNQNYPNPFNPSTTISFKIPTRQKIQVSVYDITGRKVETLINEVKPPGNYKVNFDAHNLASGIYIYKFETINTEVVRKMLLIK